MDGTIRFELRKDKILMNGKMPIRLTYSLHGQRKYYDTGIRIYPEQWREPHTVANLTAPEAKSLYNLKVTDLPIRKELDEQNKILLDLIATVREIETRFRLDKTPYSSLMVIEELKRLIPSLTKREKTACQLAEEDAKAETIRKTTEEKESVIAFIDKFCEDNTKLTDIRLVKDYRTLQVYKNVARDIEAYQKKTGVKPVFNNMTVDFLKGFFEFIVSENGNNNITASKKISTLKTLLGFAQRKEYGYCFNVNPEYREFTISRTDSKHEVIALTKEEYEAIRDVELEQKEHEIARDIFVFSCNTGLRISDLEDLKKVHLVNGTIDKLAVKTGERIKVPLSKTAKQILKKYNNDPREMMSLHRNDINEYLKEIAKNADIDAPVEKIREKGKEKIVLVQPKYERISIHVGRKTFVTLMLSSEVPATDVMALSGHRSFTSFKRYIDVSEKQRQSAIKKAFDL